jgi:hypothetical protein
MFHIRNFYKPAPAQVQRIAAACKAIAGVTAPAALTDKYKWLAGLGFILAIVGEGLEKLSAAPAPAAAPDPETDPTMKPADVEPENEHTL